MKIYSNTLSAGDIITAARACGLDFETFKPRPRARLATMGWEILLSRPGSMRFFNTGTHGAGEQGAASWADYGWFLAGLYKTDPYMIVRGSARYGSEADFHMRTGGSFRGTRQPGTTPIRVTPGRSRPAHLRETPGFQPTEHDHRLGRAWTGAELREHLTGTHKAIVLATANMDDMLVIHAAGRHRNRQET